MHFVTHLTVLLSSLTTQLNSQHMALPELNTWPLQNSPGHGRRHFCIRLIQCSSNLKSHGQSTQYQNASSGTESKHSYEVYVAISLNVIITSHVSTAAESFAAASTLDYN